MKANFETGLKICSKCKKELSLDNFHKYKENKDGLKYVCISCEKKYKEANKINILEYQKQYRQSEKSKNYQNEYQNNYIKERRKYDPIFKLACNLRNRLRKTLKLNYLPKTYKLFQYLGCSLDELKSHLEKQFQPSMIWNNYGKGKDKWNIDHIVPLDACKIYNLDRTLNIELSTKRLYELCHYTNLQPLWESDNLKKGNKIDFLEKVNGII